jgi:hypothetical protein
MIKSAHSFYGFAMDELCVVGCCVDFLVDVNEKLG